MQKHFALLQINNPVGRQDLLFQSSYEHAIFVKTNGMKKAFFIFLAKTNKILLPSFSKKRLDLSKASKFQMAIIGWRYYVTTNALG